MRAVTAASTESLKFMTFLLDWRGEMQRADRGQCNMRAIYWQIFYILDIKLSLFANSKGVLEV